MGNPEQSGEDPSMHRTIRNLDEEPMPFVPERELEDEGAFENRVAGMTGMNYADIPEGEEPSHSSFQVLALRADTRVIKTEDGQFLIVKGKKE